MVADLYRDFAYAMVTSYVDAAATTVDVDDASRLPSNADLATGDFWMTFESTYSSGQFEIVRLVTKTADTGPATLTLERARQGSSAYAHQPGGFIKHAVTATMLRTLLQYAQSAGYKRYIDLGNFQLAGVTTCLVGVSLLRGIAAGQAGGATVVSGIIVDYGITSRTGNDGTATVAGVTTVARGLFAGADGAGGTVAALASVLGLTVSTTGSATCAISDLLPVRGLQGAASALSTSAASVGTLAGSTSSTSGASTVTADLTVQAGATADSSGLVGAGMWGLP